MCLLINDIYKDALVAEKPITVYKILKKDENGYFSPYQGTKCEIGDTLKGMGFKDISLNLYYNFGIGEEGVHAYKSLFAARHSEFASSGGNFNGYNLYITEWEIPKGTTYWNGVGISCLEIAATEMKFIKVIEHFDNSNLKYLLGPIIDILNDTILQRIATHYITDEGEVKPLEKEQKVDVSHLAWVIDDLKKLIPEYISDKNNKIYKLSIEFDYNNNFCYAGYKCQDDLEDELQENSKFLFRFMAPSLNIGYIYGHIVDKLNFYGYIN